jgi:nitrogen regulatory protein P-II 1
LNIEGKVYVFDLATRAMQELNIFVHADDLSKVTEILRNHNVGGMTFYEITGAGRMKRKEIPEMVRAYQTGKKITPEFEKRTKVETIVPDSLVKEIVEELQGKIGSESEARGMIFVKEVSNAYEIGTKQSGEAVLTTQ